MLKKKTKRWKLRREATIAVRDSVRRSRIKLGTCESRTNCYLGESNGDGKHLDSRPLDYKHFSERSLMITHGAPEEHRRSTGESICPGGQCELLLSSGFPDIISDGVELGVFGRD